MSNKMYGNCISVIDKCRGVQAESIGDYLHEILVLEDSVLANLRGRATTIMTAQFVLYLRQIITIQEQLQLDCPAYNRINNLLWRLQPYKKGHTI